MFPEYRELISTLKTQDAHFQRKFNEHNQLDEEIKQLEKRVASDFNPTVKELQKQKVTPKRRDLSDPQIPRVIPNFFSEQQGRLSALIHVTTIAYR